MNAGRVVVYVGDDASRLSALESDEWDLEHVETGTEARERAAAVDSLVVEQALPDGTGLSLCREIRESFPDLPLVFVPETGDDDLAREAVSVGIDEYLPASTITDVREIRRAVARALDSTAVDPRRYRKLVEHTTDLISIVDPDGTVQYISPAIEELLGYEQADLVGTEGFQYIHPADRERIRDAFADRLSNSEETVSREYRVERADGSITWVESRARNYVDDPAIRGIVISSRDISDRKERERELSRYEAIVEAVDDLVFALDEDGQFAFANEAHESMTGLSADALLGTDPSAYMPDAAVERAQAQIEALLGDPDRTHATFEMDILDPDGNRVPCETRLTLLTDENGTFEGTAGIVRDISDRKEREELYTTLIQEANAGIIITKDESIEYLNDQMAAMLEADRGAIEGEPVMQFIAPADRQRVAANYRSRIEGDGQTSRYEIEIRTATGETVPVEVSTSLVRYRGGIGELAVVRDITERTERQRELELYERMLNTVPDMVYALDESGHFLAVNETFESETEFDRQRILDSHVSLGMSESDLERGRELIRDLLTDEHREKAIYEMEFRTQSGGVIPVENHIALLTDDDGGFRGSVGVLRDISDRQRTERRLTVLNRALRHDLRNSMHVILANAELVERVISDPEITSKLRTIQRRAEQINSLSEKAREIEQTVGERTLPSKRIDLAALLEDQTAWFRRQYPDATIETTIPDHAWVEAIELVDVAVENLIENSIEHTDDQHVEVGVDVGTETVTVTVSDTGPGIPAKERRVVSQGSETPLDHASGLGLWLVAWITRDSGGELVFEEDGQGGVVKLVLDRADGHQSPAGNGARAE
ncbi:MAG: PAS domain S-box protein [Halorientalis sp.]